MGRINTKVTLNPGTPIRVSDALQLTDVTTVNRIFIQPAHTATAGIVYVMDGIGAGRTPSKAKASDVTAELAPATATSPGSPYGDPGGAAIQFGMAPLIDTLLIWVDGDAASPVIISAVTN